MKWVKRTGWGLLVLSYLWLLFSVFVIDGQHAQLWYGEVTIYQAMCQKVSM